MAANGRSETPWSRATRHRLGFAVKVLGGGGLPSHDTRRWQSGPHLRTSLARLRAVLDHLHEQDIRMYRMATALAPYASHPDLPQFHSQVEDCAAELAAVGELARERGVRLSTHPGQYTVINSQDDGVRAAAAAELEVQAALLDAMGLSEEAVVVLHVGGGAGDRTAGIERFVRGVETLSDAARARLVVENDDRVYGLADVLEVSRRTGLRVVWDVLHHRCHDPEGIPDAEAARLFARTWPAGVRPKAHFSSPRLDVGERRRRVGRRTVRSPTLPPLRAHADMVDPIGLEYVLREAAAAAGDLDLMLEAKAKDLALITLRGQLEARGIPWEDGALVLKTGDGRG